MYSPTQKLQNVIYTDQVYLSIDGSHEYILKSFVSQTQFSAIF